MERSFSCGGSVGNTDSAVPTKTWDGLRVPLSANAPEYTPQAERREPPDSAQANTELIQDSDPYKPTAPISEDAVEELNTAHCLYTGTPTLTRYLAESRTAPINEEADTKPVEATILCTMTPDLARDAIESSTAPDEPSSTANEDSEEEEDDEGLYCWYCEDMEDHEIVNCLYLRDATTAVQRIFLQDTATCISCLELETTNPKHLCDTSNICTSCNDPHHRTIKCDVFPLTQTSLPEADRIDTAAVEENNDGALTREEPKEATPPTQPITEDFVKTLLGLQD